MHTAKIYGSKEEIYADGYALAIKFNIDTSKKSYIHAVRDYPKIFAGLKSDCQASLIEFSKDVKNFKRAFPLSVGFFVEIPVHGNTDQSLGCRFVLLEHETGLELFILHHLTWATLGIVGAKAGEIIAGAAAKAIVSAAFGELASFIRSRWEALSGAAIDNVEIRSEKKGVVRIPFSDFKSQQVLCVIERFDNLAHIIDCNQQCFGGLAIPYEPTDFTGTADTLAGTPTPPQARD